MAQRSEDGVGKTSEMSKRLERAKVVWIRPAISIQASSRNDGCINRPDTRKHLNMREQISRTPLVSEGASTHGRSITKLRCLKAGADFRTQPLQIMRASLAAQSPIHQAAMPPSLAGCSRS
jgi:hypothetical protein